MQCEQLRQHYMSKSNAEVAEAHQALQPVIQTIHELQRKVRHGCHYLIYLFNIQRYYIFASFITGHLEIRMCICFELENTRNMLR